MGSGRKGVLLVAFFICARICNAQQLLFSSLGDKVQLPAQECYNIMQDSLGYIWFSTERGLCRYASNGLTVFDRKNSLPEESVYAVKEDKAGKLWILTSNNRILRYSQGKLKEAAFNANYKKLEHTRVIPIPFYLDFHNGLLYSSTLDFAATAHPKTNKVEVIVPDKGKEHFVFLKRKGQRLIPFRRRNIQGTGEITVRIDSESGSWPVKISNTAISGMINWYGITCMAGQTDIFSIDNRLVRMNTDHTVSSYTLPGRIVSLYVDRSNGLWVGTLKHGVFYYPDVATMRLAMHSLEGYSVTGTCEDSEKGIWCSTLEKGIFYSKHKYITAYTNLSGLEKRSTLLTSLNDIVYASSEGNMLYEFKKGIPATYRFPFGDGIGFLNLIRYQNWWVIGGKETVFFANDDFQVQDQIMRYSKAYQQSKKITSYIGAYQLALQNDKFYSVMLAEVFELDKHGILDKLKLPFTGRAIIALPNGNLLIGSTEGLHELSLSTRKLRKIAGISGNVSKMIQAKSGKIWIATKGDGMYWLEKDLMRAIPIPFQLNTNVFFDIAEDHSGTIWAGSTTGLVRFRLRSDNKYEARVFNTVSGLPSNEVYKVAINRNELYFSTFEGLFSISLKPGIENFTPPAFYLRELLINKKTAALPEKKIHVAHNQNSFTLYFDILTYKNNTEAKLIYELAGPEGKSVNKSSGSELIFQNLAPGIYQLKVWALNNDGVKSVHPVWLTLEIDDPFWFTWWFICLVILALALISGLIARLIILRIKKKEEENTNTNKLIAEYQMTALQAQMNPHFIFNAINTIQGYILQKKEEEAYGYLAKFSKLIRMVLNNSQASTLTLHDELEMINLYINLEQLRFDHCFDYHLELSENIDIHDFYLPGMLIQPYIENAIWHGIRNLENSRRGKLTLAIVQEGNQFSITVTDNGVGRELAKSFQKDINHTSMAMNLTAKRLIAMNLLEGFENAQISITDLQSINGEPTGTQVTLVLPVIEKYD